LEIFVVGTNIAFNNVIGIL